MRRSREAIQAQRHADHAYNRTHRYASWRRCSRCGGFHYCAGKTYEAQRCETCAVGTTIIEKGAASMITSKRRPDVS